MDVEEKPKCSKECIPPKEQYGWSFLLAFRFEPSMNTAKFGTVTQGSIGNGFVIRASLDNLDPVLTDPQSFLLFVPFFFCGGGGGYSRGDNHPPNSPSVDSFGSSRMLHISSSIGARDPVPI